MEEVIQREKELVYRLAFSQCHQKDQADDIFQNVMYRYMKRKPVFESLEHEKAWFIRVTLNCSKTSLKSFWHNKIDEIDEQTYIFEKQEIDLTPYLNKLSKKYNVVLYLFYYEGYSTKEMAELLHIKENNVRVLLNRARNQLRKEIEADENKSFKNYYDEIQVDENLLQQIPIKKHHYYKPILIISCVVLLFVLGIQNKETKDTFEILAYNQTYNSITTQATPMDYYLIHDQVNIMDKVQLKKKYEEKYFSKKTDFKQSQLDLKNYDGKYYLDGYLTTSYFTVDVQSDEIESIRIVQGGNPLEIHLGGKVYQSDTTISYDLYKKYYHTKKGLKVIWKPEDYLFNSKIKDISDNFRIEVNYKSKASKLFEIELSFNQKGQMFVQKRKAKRTEINTELKQSKHKYLRFSTLSESETIKELKELLPQEVIDELMKNGYVYEDKKENYFNFSNDKDEPTLRLDVSYDKNNKIIQYVSKEYGFTDSITSTLEKDPIEIIKHAQDILMNQQLPLTEVILPSHYSGGNYKAYIDDSYQYVIQTDINMLVRIEKREENDIVEKEVTSNIYSYDDITSAINTVIDYFNENFKGCTLKEIYYAGDNENYFKEILQQYGADEAIVLTSTFDVDGSGGDGSLNPNSTYKDWIWLLVRNKQGEWKHVDHGY